MSNVNVTNADRRFLLLRLTRERTVTWSSRNCGGLVCAASLRLGFFDFFFRVGCATDAPEIFSLQPEP